jgi:hypothetical protein
MAEEWQRDANYRKQTYGHTDVYGEVKKEYTHDTVPIHPGEAILLPLRDVYHP